MITLLDMAKPQIRFKEVPYEQVPFREPRTTVSGTEGKSQWDDALAVIKKGAGQLEWKKKPTRAIRMDGDDAERKALKLKPHFKRWGERGAASWKSLMMVNRFTLGPPSAARLIVAFAESFKAYPL